MIRVSVIEIPVSALGAALSTGHPVEEFVPGLADGETVLALASLDGGDANGVALGTASGVVKRVQPDYPANRDEFELITLKDDDRVIGAAYLTGDDAELVFITSDAQLLRFAASSVRPQGRPAAGMAGIRLSDGATAIWFGAIGPAVTRSAQPTLPATPPNGPADNHEAAMAAMADLKAELNGEEPGRAARGRLVRKQRAPSSSPSLAAPARSPAPAARRSRSPRSPSTRRRAALPAASAASASSRAKTA